MNPYALQDRLEDKAELADWYDNSLKLRLFQSMAESALSGKIEYPAAIIHAFDDDCDFQEKIAEIARYMAEIFARNHVQIKYGEMKP